MQYKRCVCQEVENSKGTTKQEKGRKKIFLHSLILQESKALKGGPV